MYIPLQSAFQSTLPARGATHTSKTRKGFHDISIHAPRTGSDSSETPRTSAIANFNPRSPHGERLGKPVREPQRKQFQSTLPARGATIDFFFSRDFSGISIHAPRTGSDDFSGEPFLIMSSISIHAPRTGSDELQDEIVTVVFSISIHAPRTGSDGVSLMRFVDEPRFQSTLPARGATASEVVNTPTHDNISIHAPRTGSDRRR